MIEPWPLTGRAEELRFADAPGGRDQSAGVVLAGVAGVGKTRLARELVDRAARRGVVTRWVAASESARGLPLGAFAPLVGDVGDGDPARVLPRAMATVLEVPRPRGMLLAVDDAHLLDDVSAVLVQHLTLQRQARMLLTVRSGEPAPGAVVALWKDRHLDRLELQPLSAENTQALLEAVLDAPVETETARRFWKITDGNALYLRQLVDGELASGRLSRASGVWLWSGDPKLTPSLVEVIRARMGRLSPELRNVLEFLAFGEPLGVSLLTGLTDPDSVEEAERRGLIEVRSDRRRLEARLAHPLYGEVVRSDCGRVRSRTIRGRLATTLAATGGRRSGDLLRRALLSIDSDLEPDPELLTAAAGQSARLHDIPLADRLTTAAIDAGGGFEPAMIRAAVMIGVGARSGEAELAALTDHARTDEQRVRAATLQVSSLAFMVGAPERARAALDHALATVSDHPGRLTLVSMEILLDAYLGHSRRALDRAPEVLDDPRAPDEATTFACLGASVALGCVGRVGEVDDLVPRGTAAAMRSADVAWTVFPQVVWQVFNLTLTGDLDRASSLAVAATERFRDQVGPTVNLRVVRAVVELHRGRARAASEMLRVSRADLAPWGVAGGWRYTCLLYLTRATAMEGDSATARDLLVATEAVVHDGLSVFTSHLGVTRAWVAAAEGALGRAVELARDAAARAAEAGQAALEMYALHTAARFGDPSPAVRLAELARIVEGPRARAAATHAAALAAADPAALNEVSLAFEEFGDLLAAADASAQCAAAYSRVGRQGSAQSAAARANRLVDACGGARTPALQAAVTPLPLSDREREILSLAVTGLSNKEIAGRLVVSVRTVEGHRYRACTKLNTSDLTEIAALLRGE